MSFNRETFDLMLKLALGMVAVLLIVWLLAVGTPKLAKLVDKLLGRAKIDQGASSVPNPERVRDNENSDENADVGEYRVYDIYEGTPSDENNTDKKD
ncbi:MAG: hypothetical protein LUI05_03845 [Oscillospiraceae bacterium]|nr:hypothetical protein [Oscillospiraceae bacterium]